MFVAHAGRQVPSRPHQRPPAGLNCCRKLALLLGPQQTRTADGTKIRANAVIPCGARLGRGAISDAGSKIEVNSVIPHGADIADANVYHSVLSPGVVLESGVDVRHSVLLPGTVIKRGAVVRRAIIDAHVIVEAGDQIGYGTERDQSRFHVLPNGIVVVSPDHSLTAGGVTKVENYSSGESHEVPEALTDAGSVVNPHRL